MVVYRKVDGTVATATTASPEDGCDAAPPSAPPLPRAVLTSRPNSHPFQERHLVLDQPIKVGRSVARCQQALCNAIFSCKVLSRNHALLWYENGKFYLQDTKSSNGTFVNNQRLSKSSEESPPREVCSGDIVQFGVDVVENSKKVVHGCIVATLKLYLPDGKEAKASPTTAVVPLSPETSVSSQELYQLSQYLQEALHREQILEVKLGSLKKIVANTQDESESGWKALIEEDRLLSRIESLEGQLQTWKNVSEEKLKDDVMKLQDDKDKYQVAAKESLKNILQEKSEAIQKVQDLENSLSNTENECSHLLDINQKKELEIHLLLSKATQNEKDISSLTAKLQEVEEKYQDLLSQNAEEKLAQENNAEEMRKEEQILSTKIEALKAENDFANEQLNAMKAHFDILKKDQNLDVPVEKNGNVASHDEVTRLESEFQRVQKENNKNEFHLYSDTDDCTSNGDAKPPDYVNKLQADVHQLKKLLCESRDNKKLVDSELIHTKSQLEEVQSNIKIVKKELQSVSDQLFKAKQELKEKMHQVEDLESKLLSLTNENDPTRQKELIRETLDELRNPPSQDEHYIIDTRLSSVKDNGRISMSEYEDLKKDCAMYKEKIQTLESDLMRHYIQNAKLEAQCKLPTESSIREMDSTFSSGDSYFQDDLTSSDTQIDENKRKLQDAQETIVLVTERYEECNKEKSFLQGELSTFKEQYEILSVQSKIVSVCSVVPLIILAVAMMLAFYPTLSHLTATSDQT